MLISKRAIGYLPECSSFWYAMRRVEERLSCANSKRKASLVQHRLFRIFASGKFKWISVFCRFRLARYYSKVIWTILVCRFNSQQFHQPCMYVVDKIRYSTWSNSISVTSNWVLFCIATSHEFWKSIEWCHSHIQLYTPNTHRRLFERRINKHVLMQLNYFSLVRPLQMWIASFNEVKCIR